MFTKYHYRNLLYFRQDDYENLLNLYEDKCKQSEQDHSYLIHELDFVKEELEKVLYICKMGFLLTLQTFLGCN